MKTRGKIAAISALLISSFVSSGALATTPVASNGLPAEGLAGEQVCFDAGLSHTGAAGFGPYFRVVADDNLTLNSASLFGSALSVTNVGVFPSTSPFELEDPFTKTMVTGSPGQSFFLVRKSVGSVVENGPDLSTNLCVTIASAAVIGEALDVSITPVYRFGDTPTGANGPVVGAVDTASITPTLYDYTFTAASPEQEIAPNPAVNVPFIHKIDVADGSVISQVNIEQLLQNEMLASSVPTITGGTGCTLNSSPPVGTNGGTLSVDCSNVTGTAADDDLHISYTAVVDDVLNGASCAALPILHQGDANAEFPPGSPLASASNNASFVAKHITLQQEVTGNAVNPGDVFTITNNIQISAYSTPNQLIVRDTLADGLAFNSHTSLSVGGTTQTITPSTTTNADGTVSVVYDLSAAGISASAGQSIQIIYTAVVEQVFRQSAQAVLAGDTLPVSSSLSYGLTAGASSCSEGSSASVSISPISISKTIVGGATDFDPGNGITFRLRINVPSGDISSFTVTDFLPLAVFDVSDISSTFSQDIRFSPNDTLGLSPTSVLIDAGTNSIQLAFSNVDNIAGRIIEYDIDAVIGTSPYADGLTLTNIMQVSNTNTDGAQNTLVSPASFEARAPVLEGTLTQTLPTQKDAGGTVEYTLELTNVGGADAFDVAVKVPSAIGLEGAVLVSAEIGGVTASTTGSFATEDFTITGPVAPNAIIEVIFERVISDNVIPVQAITSKALASWAAAIAAAPFPDLETEQSLTVDNLSISTSVDSVSPQGSIGNVVVGDTVTYSTEVTLPESEIDGFTVDLGLPAGFSFVAGSIALDDSSFGGTVDTSPSANATGTVDNGPQVEISFAGTLVTDPDNDSTNNTFSFTFDALVQDSTSNEAITSTQTKQLTSNADFTDRIGAIAASNVSSDFAEHSLSVDTVATNADGATGGFQAGDEVTVVVTITNEGTAPAYDVEFDSIVNGDLFDLTTVSAVTTPSPYTFAYSSPTVSYTASNQTLNVNDSITFSYSAIVKDGVRSGSNFTVTSNATGSSLDGAPAVERVGTSSDDEILNTLAPTVGNLRVINTSESWTGTTSRDIFAIGEVVTYQFDAQLPEGLTVANPANSLLSVSLPNGFAYLDGTALIKADFDTSLTSANEGALSSSDAAIVPVINGRVLNFDLGDISNNDDDSNDETITITFDILVENTRVNNRANRKSVLAEIAYINQASVAQNNSTSARANIGEPNLRFSHTVRPSTVTGGNSVIYEVVLRNLRGTFNLRAWDFEIEQQIPSQLTPVTLPLQSAVLSRGNTNIAACAALSGQVLTVDTSCLPASEQYLGPNENITIQLEATVDPAIRFEEQATSRATAIASSLPGTQGTANATPGLPNADNGERTGERVVNTSGQSVNDYFMINTATVTAESPSINLSASEDTRQVGELLTLTSEIGLPTGSTEDFIVTLQLPNGLRYNNAPIRLTPPATGFSSSLSPVLTPGAGTSQIVLNFGEIANASVNAETLSIEIDVIVDNILGNQNGTRLSAQASLDYASRGQNVPRAEASTLVVEANIELAQTVIVGAIDSDAGDTITYRTQVSNTSAQATAYNVSFADVFEADLFGGATSGSSFINVSVVNPNNEVLLSSTNQPVGDADFAQSTSVVSNDTLSLSGNMLMPPSSSITLEYSVIVSNTASAGAELGNALNVSYNSNQAADSRSGADANSDDDNDSTLDNYNETASSAITLANDIAIQTTLNPIHADNDFAPGESVFIDIRLDVSEGQLSNTLITNALPTGLSFVDLNIQSGTNISYTGGASGLAGAGNNVDIDFGTLTNVADADDTNDFIVVTLEARVQDIPANVDGLVLSNSASASGGSTNVGPSTLDIDIVEPSVTATISASSNVITLGDIATFTVDISAANLAADAFDTEFEIVVPSGFTYQAGTLAGPGIIDDTDPTRLIVDVGTLSTADGLRSFVFEAQLNNGAAIGANFEFEIDNGVHSSVAGTQTQNRSYDFESTLLVMSDDSSFIDATQSLTLALDVNNNGLADPGDRLDKAVVVTNNGPRVSGVTFNEAVPANTAYVAGSLSSSSGTVDDTSGMSVDIGEMQPGATTNINFSFEVAAGTPPGTLIQAQGVVDSDGTIPELTDADGNDANGDQANEIRVGSVSTLTPSVSLSQSISLLNDVDANMAVSEGDVLEISYTISNIGSMALTQVELADLLPAGLSYVPNSLTVSGPPDPADSAGVNAANVDVTLAQVEPNERVTVTLQVSIDAPLVDFDANPNSELFSVQASLESDQTERILSDSNGNAADGAQATTITAVAANVTPTPQIVVSQTYVLTNDIDGDGLVDPGDTVRLLTSVTNTGATAANDVISGQTVPADTSLVAGSEQTSRGVISSAGPNSFEANVGSIQPGETVNTSFDVVIDALSVNTVISSQQNVSGNNFTSVDSDSNGELSDGATPTLINVSVTGAPSYALSTTLTNTSDSATVANNLVQGEVATLELSATVPAGLTRDAQLQFELPAGFTLVSSSAMLKREFDSALGASNNPGNVNSTTSGSFVSAPVSVNGSVVSLNLGNINSADNDADFARYVLSVQLDSSGVVPTAATESFTVGSDLVYNNEILLAQTIASNDVVLVLNNRMPIASNDTLTMNEDGSAITIMPLSNDTDADSGQSLGIVSVGAGSAGGTISLDALNGTIDYQPLPDFFGSEVFTYIISDGAGGFSTGTVTVNVTPSPDAPVANPDTANTNEDVPVTIDVLANDTDADNDTLSVSSASSSEGTVSISPDGDVVFTPNQDFTGVATITYTVDDGNGGTDTATVTVNVAPVNDPPTAAGQSLTTPEDTLLTIDPLLNANDIDGDTLSISNLSTSNGTVSINPDGTLNFVPAPDYTGPVTITYNVDDGNGGSVPVTVTVNVSPVNDPPVANADSATTTEDTAVTVNLLANDSDPDGDTIQVANASSNDGTVSVLPSGDVVFTPNPNFNGTAIINYTVVDSTGAVDTGTASITVAPVNDIPLVPNQIIKALEDTPVTFDPLANGIDLDNDTLTVSAITPSSGSVVTNPDGTITFTPDPDFNGPVSITYTVDDGNGGVINVTVDINVEATIDPPVANPDTATTPEDTPVTINAVANDSDPDGDPLSITAAVSPHGVTSIDSNGDVVFTPNDDFTGEASINYTLSDGTGEVATGTITVTVTPVNDAPIASDQTLVTLEDTALIIDPLLNASDIDGDPLSITNIVVSNGSVSMNADGTLTYTPDANFNGPVTITYFVDDGNGGSVPVTVNINVQATVDAPVANPDTATTSEDQAVTIDVLANDTDADNEALTVVQASSSNGIVSIDANGDLLFTPNADFNGTAIINYVIEDTSGEMASSTVSVTVTPINDAPTAQDISETIAEDTVLNIDVIDAASDADNDTLTISSISVDEGSVTVGPDGTVFYTPPENFVGSALITYTLDDGNGGTVTATIDVTVAEENDEPELEPFDVTVPGNDASIIDILSLVEDVDSTNVSLSSATVPVGTIVINQDGTVTFTPPPGFEGTVIAQVCVQDDQGAQVCAEVTINVVIDNTPPVAFDLDFVTDEDTSLLLDITASDEQNDELTYTILTQPNGVLSGSGPNFTYIPPEGFVGTTTFTYEVSDGQATSQIATVTIEVAPVNDAPIANDDFVDMDSSQTSLIIDVLANDEDPDGDALSIIGATASVGSVSIVDGQLVYVPLTGFVGNDIIEYTITDADGLRSTARVLVSVGRDGQSLNPVIDVPADITIDATGLFTKVDLGVASAVDSNGNPLPVSIIDGLVLYEPGVNTVFYVAEDSEGRRTIASQNVFVNPLITIQNDQTVLEGSRIRVSVHLNGEAPSYPLQVPYTVSGTADSSDHELISGSVTFDNVTETFIEFDSFSDGIEEGTETVVITLSNEVNIGSRFVHVVNIGESNIDPEIDLIPTQNGETRNVVLADGGPVVISSAIRHPDPNNQYQFDWSNTELTLSDIDVDDSTFTFDPSGIAPGVYQINVSITDIDDPSFSDTTVIFIQIVNSFPVLGDDDTDLDGISDVIEGFNDTDGDGIADYLDATSECNVLPEEARSIDRYLVEGDPGVCLRIGNFAFGTQSGGALLYESLLSELNNISPDPIATNVGGIFDFIAYGLPEAGQAYRVVLPQRRPIPTGAVYRKYTITDGWDFFDESGENTLSSAPGEPGFCPPPGDALWENGLIEGYWCVQLQIVDGGPNDADAVANTNVIDPGFVGVVFVQPNSLPDAVDDAIETFVDVPVTIDALANDTDPENDPLTITSVSAFFGSVTVEDGEVVYIPAPGFVGIDEITYGISDANGGTDIAVIRVTVKNNFPPIAVDDVFNAQTRTGITIDALTNDSDPENGPLQIIEATSNDGTVVIRADGRIEFTPNSGSVVRAIINYTIADERGLTDSAVITINIAAQTVRIENKSDGGSLGAYFITMLLIIAAWRRLASAPSLSRSFRAFPADNCYENYDKNYNKNNAWRN
ncbi:tandem-95 repeat protein [Glaciecola siphonariae]|uniref:Tandem-95 repeat protein n=1 Tax=Glaciecola siphonariae TaxID=521012 RepID=A0ABV9LZR3_9ALTE